MFLANTVAVYELPADNNAEFFLLHVSTGNVIKRRMIFKLGNSKGQVAVVKAPCRCSVNWVRAKNDSSKSMENDGFYNGKIVEIAFNSTGKNPERCQKIENHIRSGKWFEDLVWETPEDPLEVTLKWPKDGPGGYIFYDIHKGKIKKGENLFTLLTPQEEEVKIIAPYNCQVIWYIREVDRLWEIPMKSGEAFATIKFSEPLNRTAKKELALTKHFFTSGLWFKKFIIKK